MHYDKKNMLLNICDRCDHRDLTTSNVHSSHLFFIPLTKCIGLNEFFDDKSIKFERKRIVVCFKVTK